jgi:hypothetical protein
VVVQAPPFTEYCKVEPVGQGVVGAAMLPSLTVQFAEQMLFTTLTLAGAAVKVGQATQLPVTVVVFTEVQPLLSVIVTT